MYGLYMYDKTEKLTYILGMVPCGDYGWLLTADNGVGLIAFREINDVVTWLMEANGLLPNNIRLVGCKVDTIANIAAMLELNF